MKQLYDYDCGHLCLVHQGFTPPRVNRPLFGAEVAQATKTDISTIKLVSQFDGRGIYLLFNPNRAKDAHYVSLRNDFIYDPATGEQHQPADVYQRYSKNGFYPILYIPCGENE